MIISLFIHSVTLISIYGMSAIALIIGALKKILLLRWGAGSVSASLGLQKNLYYVNYYTLDLNEMDKTLI